MDKTKIFSDGFSKGSKDFSVMLIDIVNFILLSIVYFVGVGSVSIIGKVFRKNFLDLKSNKKSSWKLRNLSKIPLEEYYRTF